ncbi:hypothetical protein BDN70DRAFT_885908 [Pholiota conissans]|uniref:F-box domain-containing protein n=1 Tax=Pholiota conissans TaxID=109636 RepID=A0A9P5YQQ8_9AGAR|nr:hypothetical protein BDN70DRAFT_885908 [Pholiota conissans]
MSQQIILAEGPINKVPYDVLSEIFTYCTIKVNPYSNFFDTSRERFQMTPIALSHVSSSWRTVAFTTPLLWSHLYYRFTMVKIGNSSIVAESHERHFLQRDIDFIRWWKEKHKSLSPVLTFDIKYERLKATGAGLDLLARNGDLNFILSYLATSKYLWIDNLFWDKIRKWIEQGNKVSFPNLHTLIYITNRIEVNHVLPVQTLMGLASEPSAAFPLRRLYLHNIRDEMEGSIPVHWSSLTDICFDFINEIDLHYWNSLVRTLQHLRSAYFNFGGIYWTENINIPTITCTLSHLETLYVGHYEELDRDQFSFSLFFANIHLPALRTLSLSSWAPNWSNHRVINNLHSVLRSTPNITTLILGEEFLALECSDFEERVQLSAITEPLWRYAPRLMHFRLELRSVDDEEALEQLDNNIKNIVDFGNIWLDLDNPACPIRTFTIVSPLHWTADTDFAPSRERTLRARYPNIEFRLTNESMRFEASKAWETWI